MRRKDDISLGWEHNSLCALLEGCLKLKKSTLSAIENYFDSGQVRPTRGIMSAGSVVSLWANSSL